MTKIKNSFEKAVTTKQGEFIIPVGFGKFEEVNHDHRHTWFKLKENPSFMIKKEIGLGEDFNGEILFDLFAEEFDLDAINVYPAVLLNKDGKEEKVIAMQNFLTNPQTQTIIDSYDLTKNLNHEVALSIEGHLEGLELLKQEYKSKGKQLEVNSNVQEKLFTMGLLDFLSLNTDRHAYNVSYIIEKVGENKYVLNLSQMYDNGYAFMIGRQKFMVKSLDEYLQNEFAKNFKFNILANKEPMVQQLAISIVNNETYQKIYEKAKSYDFNKIGQKLKQKYPNYKISKKDFEMAKQVFKTTLKALDKQILKTKSENKNKTKITERAL